MNLTESTLLAVTEYLVGGAQRCQPWALPMILQALGAVVYENVGLLTKVSINDYEEYTVVKKEINNYILSFPY